MSLIDNKNHYKIISIFQIQPGTLNPFWDQTLLFRQITLYGSSEFITENPPSVVIEVYDEDKCVRTYFLVF